MQMAANPGTEGPASLRPRPPGDQAAIVALLPWVSGCGPFLAEPLERLRLDFDKTAQNFESIQTALRLPVARAVFFAARASFLKEEGRVENRNSFCILRH
jgi:hypothetical protein